MELIKITHRKKFEKKMSDELKEIFENLEEGILLIKNNSINFANRMFYKILKSINIISSDDLIKDSVLDLKIFCLFRSTETSDKS